MCIVLVVLCALAALGASPAQATEVTGTFKYKDTNPTTGEQTDRPITGAKVEIWRFRSRCLFCLWTWGKDGETTTDANGRISVNMAFAGNGVVYGLRVFATNDAAIVWPNDAAHTLPFHREPGQDDGRIINHIERSPTAVLDFSYTFHGDYSPQHFNIAEVARHGKAFADARRAAGETDPITPAAFQPTSIIGSYYNAPFDTVVINSGDVNYDYLILHEYAHYLEERISSFAPLPTIHDGCWARITTGNPPQTVTMNSPEHAWMEGFANYFAQAVGRSVPQDTLTGVKGTKRTYQLERAESLCPGYPSETIPGDAVEYFVAGTLHDLSDQPYDTDARFEESDELWRMDREIIQIFDRELDVDGVWPTITDFRHAWMTRGLPGYQLGRIMAFNKVPLRRNYGPWAFAGVDQTVNEGTPVTLDGRKSNDPDLNPVSYTWNQVSGPAVTLTNPSNATPSFTAPQLSSGSATLVFRLVVSDGTAPPSAPDNVAVRVLDVPDTEPPAAPTIDLAASSDSGASATDNLTNDSTPTLIGKAEAGSTVTVYEGDVPRGTSTASNTGDWSVTTATLANGAHAFTARAVDAAGNRSEFSVPLTVNVDRTSPSVGSVTPANLATGVSPATNVAATFSEKMGASSIFATTFKLARLVRRADGTIARSPVAATVRYDATRRRATLDPGAGLVLGARYEATITTGVRDLAGNALLRNKVWTFTVRR